MCGKRTSVLKEYITKKYHDCVAGRAGIKAVDLSYVPLYHAVYSLYGAFFGIFHTLMSIFSVSRVLNNPGKMDILTTRNILDDMGHIFRIF